MGSQSIEDIVAMEQRHVVEGERQLLGKRRSRRTSSRKAAINSAWGPTICWAYCVSFNGGHFFLHARPLMMAFNWALR